MKHLTRWILALLAVAAVASLSAAWTSQEGKQDGKKKEPQVEKISQTKKPQVKNRALKHAEILRALPTLKMTLVEAVQQAEKEVGGKAISADIEVDVGKPMIQVNLFINDKFTATKIDPATKKLVILSNKGENGEEGKEGASGDDEGEGEEGG